MSGPSISDIVHHHIDEHDGAPPEVLIQALVQREEAMADMLRMAGVQFGLYPQIVAEVLAQVEMGVPIEVQQREFIRAQFVALMEELQRQHGQQG